MTKLIFLDVDGVLNSENFFREKEKKSLDFENLDIDPKSVILLNEVIKETDAKVVITSTWRLHHYDKLLHLLKKYGFIGSIIGKTDRSNCFNCLRGNLIQSWIRNNRDDLKINTINFNNYVIIDDNSDMLLWQKDNFVQTDASIGLTKEDVFKCIQILNKEWK